MANLNVLSKETKYGNIFGIEGFFNSFLDDKSLSIKRNSFYLKEMIKRNNLKLKFLGFVTTKFGIVKNYEILNYKNSELSKNCFLEKEILDSDLKYNIGMESLCYPSLKNKKIVDTWFNEINTKELIKTNQLRENSLDSYISFLEYNINHTTDIPFLNI